MSMKDGIRVYVASAIDTASETAWDLIDGGLEPKEAIKASAILTKQSVNERLERNFANQNAAGITHRLKRKGSENRVLN